MRIKYQILILLTFAGFVLANRPRNISASDTSFNLSEEIIKQAKDIAAKKFSTDLSERRPEGLSKLDTQEDIRNAIDESMKELGDDDREDQDRGFLKLKYLGKYAFFDIVKGLESENKNVRQWCITLLGDRGSEAVPYLGKVLLTDSENSIRSSAARYLGQTYDPKAVPFLLEALNDKDLSVCRNAAHALAYIRDKRAFEPLKKLVEDTECDGQVRYAAAETLFRIDEQEASVIIKDAIEKESNEYMRPNFGAVLRLTGGYPHWPPQTLGLLQLKNDADTLAGESFTEEEKQLLLDNIDSPFGTVASGCMYTLANLKASEAVSEMIARSTKSYGFYSCLAQIGSREAVDYIIESIQSNYQDTRISAIEGLKYADAGKWMVPILIELLNDPSLRTTHEGLNFPVDFFDGRWPDSHRAYDALYLCLGNHGLRGTMINLASGKRFDIDEEIKRVKEWWENYGQDFLQGKTVPDPKLKGIMLIT